MQCTAFLLLIFNVVFSQALTIGRKLPPGIKPCSRAEQDFKKCLMKNAVEAVPSIAKGIPSYSMWPLDPMHVNQLVIDDRSSNSRLAIAITMKDVDIIGLGTTKVKSIDMSPDSSKVRWSGLVPSLSLIGDYDISGRVLILPITGKGPMNITLENLDFVYEFEWKEGPKRQGRSYIDTSDYKLKFDTTRCYIKLDNLFNGDKRLGNNMNSFLNENWKLMVEDLGPPIGDAVNAGLKQVITTLLKQVPHDEIFPASE